MSETLYDGMQVTLTESERFFVSKALDVFISEAAEIPELGVSLAEILALHSKFLLPSDVI
jgi:hypothetical protein